MKWVIIVLIAVVTICGLLIGIDYMSYKNGNRSHLFGTLDNYSQSQTLKFGNLNLRVTNVVVKAYPKPTVPEQVNCSTLSDTNPNQTGSTFFKYFGSPQDICQSHLDDYHNQLNLYQHTYALTIYFSYSNVSSKPLNLSAYKAKVIANTGLGEGNNADYPSIHPSCSGLPGSQLLKGNSINSCFTMDIGKSYSGPIELSIISAKKEKDISLNLPSD